MNTLYDNVKSSSASFGNFIFAAFLLMLNSIELIFTEKLLLLHSLYSACLMEGAQFQCLETVDS